MKKTLNMIVIGLLPVWLGCVDKVNLDLPVGELPIIVEGMVTDQPGPDTVILTKAYPADGKGYNRVGIEGAEMAISDDTGFVDSLIDIGRGIYVTDLLNGVIGRTYQLSFLLRDTIDLVSVQTTAISTPQRMLPAGSIDAIYYEFTTRVNTNTGLPENGFKVYVNSTVGPESNRRMLWNFMGTYKTTTDPSQVIIISPCATYPDCPSAPIACATDCMCCTCWYNTYEKSPIVSDPRITGGLQLNRAFIQYIPINESTFFEKYRVEVTQMEVSEDVFNFYEGIRKQADNAVSIFQPPFSELKGNITVQSGPGSVLGAFGAGAVVTSHIYIHRNDVPYQLPGQLRAADCRAIAENSTLTKPFFWE